MDTMISEVAPDIFRISTFVPEIGPTGFTFNQFLIRAEEPLLFHTGPRHMFPAVQAAAAKLISVKSLRWIAFGHVESDECGSMNEWLQAAPHEAEAIFKASCLTPMTGSTIRSLAELDPAVLGVMHGSSFNGDCAHALHDLASMYDDMHAAAGLAH